MTSQKQFQDLIAQVQDHLALLQEDGVRALPFERPWAPPKPAQVSKPVRPRVAPAPTRPARNPAAPAALSEGLRMARARRLASCGDPGDPAQYELLVCSVVETFEQPAPRKLLDDILRATGYEITAIEEQRDLAVALEANPPRAILALGDLAVRALSGKPAALRLIRGKWDRVGGVDMLPTFAPGYLLDHQPAKAAVWGDMQNLAQRLGLALPPRKNT